MAIVLPVYNEAATIERSVEAVAELAGRYPAPARVIAVDDGSADDSAAILEGMAARVDALDFVRHAANAGYGAALRTGARRAAELGLEYVTFMDSDLTNPPEDVLKIGALAAQGHPYIKASRFIEGGRMDGVPPRRAVFSRAGNLVAARLYGTGISDPTNGFRAMKTELAHALAGQRARLRQHRRGARLGAARRDRPGRVPHRADLAHRRPARDVVRLHAEGAGDVPALPAAHARAPGAPLSKCASPVAARSSSPRTAARWRGSRRCSSRPRRTRSPGPGLSP